LQVRKRTCARGIAADVLPFPEGNGGTGADSPTAGEAAKQRSAPARPKPLIYSSKNRSFYTQKLKKTKKN
jgi:hypothetical protein